MLAHKEYTKIGHTSIILCEPSPERNQFYVAAIGGRMFGSAYFPHRTEATAFYKKLVEKATGCLCG